MLFLLINTQSFKVLTKICSYPSRLLDCLTISISERDHSMSWISLHIDKYKGKIVYECVILVTPNLCYFLLHYNGTSIIAGIMYVRDQGIQYQYFLVIIRIIMAIKF